MKTTLHNLMLRPFCLVVVAASFCVTGCGSPEPETPTPKQNDTEVVEMNIKSSDSTEDTGSDNKTEEPSASPSSSSESSKEAAESSSNDFQTGESSPC